MDLQLKGRKVVITGGTRGIGRAAAETFADEGADVAICARDADQVEAAVESLKSKGGRAFGSAVDVTDGPALEGWIASAAADLGGIDSFVANPSALKLRNLEEHWRAGFEVDVIGTVRAVDAALPFLQQAAAQSGEASIVVMGSGAAAEADVVNSYGPIKAALTHFAKGIARQYAPEHIRTNVVSPGTIYFDGGFWQQEEREDPEHFKLASDRNPMGRMGTREEVAKMIVFLSSPASSFTTGANMVIDGGFGSRVSY
jgi:3-oxoacyl-[acyl-carrier protein] reductase